MAQIIQLKRGLIADVEAAHAQYGEILLAYNAEKSRVEVYVGTGENSNTGKVRINPDIPTNVSAFTNDSGFQTASDVSTAIAQAIAGLGTASFQKVNAVPAVADAEDNVLYLVMNSTTNHYDIYAKIDGAMELIDDTTVDLSGYVTTSALETALDGKVDKVTGKGLSTEDYTTVEKNKLGAINGSTGDSQTASAAEKAAWNAKLDSTSTIDGGTF